MQFECEECHVVENTANCGYWNNGGKHICSLCDPAIGKWHNRFPRRTKDNLNPETGEPVTSKNPPLL